MVLVARGCTSEPTLLVLKAVGDVARGFCDLCKVLEEPVTNRGKSDQLDRCKPLYVRQINPIIARRESEGHGFGSQGWQ